MHADSSPSPLGEPCAEGYIRVIHPAVLRTSGSLTTFCDARVGMDICMLDAAPETLAKKISQNARALIEGADFSFEEEDLVGALNIFCGGLVMAIDDIMPKVAEELADVVGHNNTMGICCFGEQGMDQGRKAIHGNLMFGCLLFSNKMRETKTLDLLPDSPRGTCQKAIY